MNSFDVESHTSPSTMSRRRCLSSWKRTEPLMGSLLADDITYVLKIEFDNRLGVDVPRDGCVLPSPTRALHHEELQVLRVGQFMFVCTTLFQGIERMTKELTALAPPTTFFEVVSSPVRRYSVRIGGSVLPSVPSSLQQSMFETFNVPARNVPILFPFASKRTTGVVMDSCDVLPHTVPTYQSHAVPRAIPRYPLY